MCEKERKGLSSVNSQCEQQTCTGHDGLEENASSGKFFFFFFFFGEFGLNIKQGLYLQVW